ncbi:Lar family restriction alleviation protein [Vibrio sp. YMD68]|uniref:Lar family restriction alleviation protein n=1 Tax=Vibrio sp. YMD68 TaxID=3042300 RepID=UPI00249A7D9A|nr:Lar family restriction alleviation protein [Vibrio sp. YMD68]WGW00336.1 Lar family restriction alleviation protein [Vibrio sp. YMD68]WGW00983.1 Lar family restriction alleviation protein [Vibrio sp. YMD68]
MSTFIPLRAIKDCQHCGSNEAYCEKTIFPRAYHKPVYTVVCVECGCESEEAYTHNSAIEAWNMKGSASC